MTAETTAPDLDERAALDVAASFVDQLRRHDAYSTAWWALVHPDARLALAQDTIDRCWQGTLILAVQGRDGAAAPFADPESRRPETGALLDELGTVWIPRYLGRVGRGPLRPKVAGQARGGLMDVDVASSVATVRVLLARDGDGWAIGGVGPGAQALPVPGQPASLGGTPGARQVIGGW